jgi:hypothetical protein
VRVVAVERRADTYDRPCSKRGANRPGRLSMLAKPRPNTATARASADRAPARIGPAPQGPIAAPGEHVLHVVQMHHELVVRELALAELVRSVVAEPLAILLEGLRRPIPPLLDSRLRKRGRLRLCVPTGRDWRRRRIKRRCSLPGAARLAPTCSRQRARTLALGYLSLRRRGRRRRLHIAVEAVSVGVALYRLVARGSDVQRHHPVASQVAARRRLLRDDEPGQLLRAAERAVKARAQSGTTHGLRGIAGWLPHVIAYSLASRWAAPAGGLRALNPALWRCGSVGHRGY